jgi:preprotein translocase subunit SecG
MLYYLLVSVYVLVCLLLIVVILLQQGKGGDIANAFGGGGSQAAFGARAGATLLTKLTTGLAAAFIVLSLTLAAWGQRGPGSVVGGTEAPAPQPAVPATLPESPVTLPAPPTNGSPR